MNKCKCIGNLVELCIIIDRVIGRIGLLVYLVLCFVRLVFLVIWLIVINKLEK